MSSKPAAAATKNTSSGSGTGKPSKSKPPSSSSTTDDPTKTHKLALKGSAKLVAEFFDYSINTILFQRGVYPAEDFTPVRKYGLNMLVTCDDQVKSYIRRIMSQLNKWMLHGKVSKLVVVITDKDGDRGDLERWQFDVQLLQNRKHSSSARAAASDENAGDSGGGEGGKEDLEREKTEAEIQAEIQSLFRQITASVTFLPMLDGRCTFNVLVYADGDVEVPMEWGDSDAREINGGEKVALRSWGTSSHRVDTLVSYRLQD